jgi:hypothetical protein
MKNLMAVVVAASLPKHQIGWESRRRAPREAMVYRRIRVMFADAVAAQGCLSHKNRVTL